MEFLYTLGGLGLILIVLLLVTWPLSRKPYRCQLCGFETYSLEEAAGHEKLENAHKVVQ